MRDVRTGRRTTRRFRISPTGVRRLREWLTESPVEFPVLKHPVALRLLLGHLTGADAMRQMLDRYADALRTRRAELTAVREGIGDDERLVYPALVAEWGLRYYDDEAVVVAQLAERLRATAAEGATH